VSVVVTAVAGVAAFVLAVFLFNWDKQNQTRRGHPLLGLLALVPYVVAVLIA
jgi:hypothetical protein